MDRGGDADAVDQNRSKIGKNDTETEPQIAAFLFFNPVQRREHQHEEGDHHKADAGAGGRHEEIISMAGVSLMRQGFKKIPKKKSYKERNTGEKSSKERNTGEKKF